MTPNPFAMTDKEFDAWVDEVFEIITEALKAIARERESRRQAVN